MIECFLPNSRNLSTKPCKRCGTLTGGQFGYCQTSQECKNANIREYRKTKRGKGASQKSSKKTREKRYDNIEYWVFVKFAQWRYGAKKRGVEFSLSKQDIPISDRCAVTGIKFELSKSKTIGSCNDKSPSLDRIDANLGYIPGNVRLVVAAFNRAKGMVEHSKYRQRLIIGLLADMDNWSKEVYNDE